MPPVSGEKMCAISTYSFVNVKLSLFDFFFRFKLPDQIRLGLPPSQAEKAVVHAWPGQKPHQDSLKLIGYVLECHVPQYGTAGLNTALTLHGTLEGVGSNRSGWW